MITDKEHDSKVWLSAEIAKALNITQSKANSIVHLCFEEFKANVETYNEELSNSNTELKEELADLRDKMKQAIQALS